MRKSFIILLFVAGVLWAQTDPATGVFPLEAVSSVQDLDLDDASIHQAGPNSFYIRSVGIGDTLYSLTFAQDTNGIWTLTTLNPESDNILPARTVLDFASLTAVDAETIYIDGVFVDGEVYSGALSVGDDADLSLAGDIAAGSVDAVNEARTLALAELAVAESAVAFEEELDDQRAELEAIIAQVQAERDGYKSERDALADTRDELIAERDSLAAQLATISAGTDTTVSAAEDDGSLADSVTSRTLSLDGPPTEEQVLSLMRERDELAGNLVGVALENNELRDQARTLEEQIADLQVQNEQLRVELAAMTTEIERLTGLVESYRAAEADGAAAADAVAADEATVEVVTEPADDELIAADAPADDVSVVAEEPSVAELITAAVESAVADVPEWTLPGDYLRKADLDAAAEQLTSELKTLQGRVASLEAAAAELAGLEESLRMGVGEVIDAAVSAAANGVTPPPVTTDTVPETPPAADAAVADAPSKTSPADEARARAALAAAERAADDAERAAADAEAELAGVSAELAALVRQNEELRRQARELENRILSEILSNGLVAMMSERMTDTVRSGFAGSEPDVGEWTVTGRRAVQSDSDAFFAKLAVPSVQSDEPMLYSFRVRSLDPDGWVGVGLHFFVSDVELRRGYGMGKSLLVWLTRDPDVYKTQLTYLQLYRSDDDINMGRVLDSVIEEPISEFLDIEILYEPDNQYLTVAIDGEDKVRYRTWFGIDTGIEVALRTLGAAEFTDFRMRAEPSEAAWVPAGAPIAW